MNFRIAALSAALFPLSAIALSISDAKTTTQIATIAGDDVQVTDTGSIIIAAPGARALQVEGGTDAGDVVNNGVLQARGPVLEVASGASAISVQNSGVIQALQDNINQDDVGGGDGNGTPANQNTAGIVVYGASIQDAVINDSSALVETTVYGIFIEKSVIEGGLENSGSIVLSALDRYDDFEDAAAVQVIDSTIRGGVTNTGTISDLTGGEHFDAFEFLGSTVIGGLTNAGTLAATSDGIIVYGSSDVSGGITNTGTISAGSDGIQVDDSTVAGGITNSGSLSAGNNGFEINGASVSGGIANSGSIVADDNGIYVSNGTSVLGGIANSGSIAVGDADPDFSFGIYVLGGSNVVEGLVNLGDISAGDIGIRLGLNSVESSVSGGVTNSGNIFVGSEGSFNDGIRVESGFSVSDGITNIGKISAGKDGIELRSDSVVSGGIKNTGTISVGQDGIELDRDSVVSGGIKNTGTISVGDIGIELDDATLSGGISNSGSISAVDDGVNVSGSTVNGGITNSGTISADEQDGIFFQESSRNSFNLDYFENSGTIRSNGSDGVDTYGVIQIQEGFLNSGLIEGVGTSVELEGDGGGNASMIQEFVNSGTLQGGDLGVLLFDQFSIPTFSNSGLILTTQRLDRSDKPVQGAIVVGLRNGEVTAETEAVASQLGLQNTGTIDGSSVQMAVLTSASAAVTITNEFAGQIRGNWDAGDNTDVINRGQIQLERSDYNATIGGDLTAYAGSTLSLTVVDNSADGYSQWSVGSLTTPDDEFNLHLSVEGDSSIFDGDVFTNVIAASGPITTTDVVVTDDSFFFSFVEQIRAASGAIDLVATKELEFSDATDAVSAANLRSLARAAEAAGGDVETVLASVMSYNTAGEIADVIQTLGPVLSADLNSTAARTMAAFGGVVATRNSSLLTLPKDHSGLQRWVEVYGTSVDNDAAPGVAALSGTGTGLAAGGETRIGQDSMLGMAISVANSDAVSSFDHGHHELEVDNVMASLYGKSVAGRFVSSWSITGGLSTNETSRAAFDGSVASAKFDGYSLTGRSEVARNNSYGSALLSPYFFAQASRIWNDGYQEQSEGDLALLVDSSSHSSFMTGLGLRFETAAHQGWSFDGHLEAGMDMSASDTQVSAAFADGTRFTLTGAKADNVVVDAGIGATYGVSEASDLSLDASLNQRGDNSSYGWNLRYRWNF